MLPAWEQTLADLDTNKDGKFSPDEVVMAVNDVGRGVLRLTIAFIWTGKNLISWLLRNAAVKLFMTKRHREVNLAGAKGRNRRSRGHHQG